MGCSQSTIESEESVTRCKFRKSSMKESVRARNAFAAGHSSYAITIKNTGAALTDFAQAELPGYLVHSSQIPPSSIAGSSSSGVGPSAIPSQLMHNTLPPPPPLPDYPSPLLQRAASMPHMNPSLKQPEVIKSEEATIMEVIEEPETPEHEKLMRRSGRSKRGDRGVLHPPQVSRDDDVVRSQQVPFENNFANYLFSPVDSIPGPTLADPMEAKNSTARSEKEYRMNNEAEKDRGNETEEEDNDDDEVEDVVIIPDVKKKADKLVEVPIQVPVTPVTEKKEQVKRSVNGGNLLSLFKELDDHFLKASQSTYDVTKMLEATRLHYHSNFADNRGHINHSARVMRVITWKLLQDDGVDEKDDFDSEENETHATVLDKILAWEKKLYDEVKVGEQMKYDYQKKVALLNKKKKRGANPESLEKLKAAVSHLHTRYIVDMQSMDSTVAEINRLRDEQLYPKLAQLVNAMAIMWDMMRKHHEAHFKISIQLRSMDISPSPTGTSRDHHDRTNQLAAVVDEWHLDFCSVIDHQKNYIKALSSWLKLNLIPIESSWKEKVSSPPHIRKPPIQDLVSAWDAFMDTLQDDGARSAIKNFAAAIRSISQLQEEELQLKQKCEEIKQELARKTRQFEDWRSKYTQQNIPDETDPDRAEENPHREAIAERQNVVEALRKRLMEEENNLQKKSLHVREKSLATLNSRLPELFKAMSDIAKTFSDNYWKLSSISQTRYTS